MSSHIAQVFPVRHKHLEALFCTALSPFSRPVTAVSRRQEAFFSVKPAATGLITPCRHLFVYLYGFLLFDTLVAI
jgi:hypothetical protein